jgi:Patched family
LTVHASSAGVPFTSLTQILPFIVFGIGLDDSFIVFGEFGRTDPRKDSVQRIHATFNEVGLSIALTKLTTIAAFALGCTSNIPATYWLSIYAFTTVTITAFFQLTFFVALVVVDESRIESNRRDCCFCLSVSRRDESEAMVDSSVASYLSRVESRESSNKVGYDGDHTSIVTAAECALPRSRADRLMGWYCDQLVRPCVKGFVVLIFMAMTVGLAYSATLFTQEFNLMEMLPGDSFVKDYLSAMKNHGERGWIIPAAYFRNVDQSDPHIQDLMESYINELATMSTMTEPPPFFWLKHFRAFLTYDDRLLDMTFNQQMDIFLSIDHFKALYGDHIIRDPETGDITASRCVLYMDNVDLNAVASQMQAWNEQRAITNMQTINAGLVEEEQRFFLYESTMLFVWEFYGRTEQELISSSVLGIAAVAIIGFVLMPHWTATLYMLPIISILYSDMIGTL